MNTILKILFEAHLQCVVIELGMLLIYKERDGLNYDIIQVMT